MARLLCLDTEPETIRDLKARGHEVLAEELGYRTGRRYVPTPPHEADAIVFDLKRPACFDHLKWGPQGGNDNFNCTIVSSFTNEEYLVGSPARRTPRYQVVYDSQIENERRPRPLGTFGPYEVHQAIAAAGTPLILFLNPEWIAHIGGSSPNIFGAMWEFTPTTAHRVETLVDFREVIPEVDGPLAWTRPLRFAIAGQPRYLPKLAQSTFQELPLVTNTIGQRFGLIHAVGRGRAFLLPPCPDNAALADVVVTRMEPLTAIPVFRPSGSPLPIPSPANHVASVRASSESTVTTPIPKDKELGVTRQPTVDASRSRDIFISYASEDREEVARPLAERLVRSGLQVWFDEYELKIGDSLSRKIDEGLRASRYGVVILSHSFFARNWPQRELAGLVALTEAGQKKILPVWHGLTEKDVKQYSPTLADVYAAKTSQGLDRVAEEISRVVQLSTE